MIRFDRVKLVTYPDKFLCPRDFRVKVENFGVANHKKNHKKLKKMSKNLKSKFVQPKFSRDFDSTRFASFHFGLPSIWFTLSSEF